PDAGGLVMGAEVVGVAGPVAPDPAEVREAERLMRTDAVRGAVGLDEGRILDEQVLVDEGLADVGWGNRPEDGLDEGWSGHLGGALGALAPIGPPGASR